MLCVGAFVRRSAPRGAERPTAFPRRAWERDPGLLRRYPREQKSYRQGIEAVRREYPGYFPQMGGLPYNEPMSTPSRAPILATKLYTPPLRPDAIPRPRLIQRLDRGLHGKLTLVSAAAGFGKTTLVSAWIADCGRPAAWLSLDEADSDPVRFLRYVVAALGTVAPELGESALAALNSPQPPGPETVLTGLLNEIAALPTPFLLVLDDYHVLDAPPVDQALAFLLDHQPPQMHLVITTREDPPLPLARLRARGQMTELRAADLRFTPDEAAGFLTQGMGLALSAAEVEALEARTEGWIAGLQMAALSLQGRTDTAAFVDAFTGSHRFVLDYLVEEVLQRQPPAVRTFLLQTAILDRLSGPLCQAVTGQAQSGAMLATLERANLFVVPLDDRRNWYRYHHLFVEMLLVRSATEQTEPLAVLHRRASRWYAHNGLTAEAIHHALAGEDFDVAAGLIERVWPEMDSFFRTDAWLKWADALPDATVSARPVLIVSYAWALLNNGDLVGAETRLREAEALLAPETGQPAPDTLGLDSEQFANLLGSVATAWAYTAQSRGDIPGSITHAQRALDLLDDDDHVRRGPAASLLGLAQWAIGDLEAAHGSLAAAMNGFRAAGRLAFAISGTYGLADMRVAQGRLGAAIRVYEQALELATAQDGLLLPGTTDLYLGLAELHRERGDPAAAASFMAKNDELGEEAALQDWPYRMRRVKAQFAVDAGDFDSALALLDEAEQLYFPTPVPNVRSVAGMKARVWLAQGRVAEAKAWASAQGISVDGTLTFLNEFEHITLARILMADGETDVALTLLDRLNRGAASGGRLYSVMEILILTALAHHRQGELSTALEALSQALALAEPEGFVRIFVDEGPNMADLLGKAAAQRVEPAYVARLLAAFDGAASTGERAQHHPQPPVDASAPAPVTPLLDPLSEREMEVLHLLTTELSGPQIADHLVVSLNTLRTHTKNIYSKLGVGSRRAAVRRAQELGLL